MLKTYRLKNLLMAGQITAPDLEMLLRKRDYLGALYDLRNDRVWMADILQNPMAVAVLTASETTMTAMLASDMSRTMMLASEIAMAAVVGSETAVAAVLASDATLVATTTSETAISAINSSSLAKEALFLSTRKQTRSFSYNNSGNIFWDNIAAGRGFFVRFKGNASSNHKIRVDGTKEIPILNADFFSIIPYTSNLEFQNHSGGEVHYIPLGA